MSLDKVGMAEIHEVPGTYYTIMVSKVTRDLWSVEVRANRMGYNGVVADRTEESEEAARTRANSWWTQLKNGTWKP